MTRKPESRLTLVFEEPCPSIQAVDIVAISGLGGISSWKPTGIGSKPGDSQSGLWLRDQLPSDLPVSRTYVFDYAWDHVGGGSFIAWIADNLLTQLGDTRSKQDYLFKTPRPLLILCHSIGGLILKFAVVRALGRRSDKSAGDILASIRGIVFFGTPHAGSPSDLRRTLSNIGGFKSTQPSMTVVQYLQRIIIKFAKVIPQAFRCRIFSFFEELPLAGESCLTVNPGQTLLWDSPRIYLPRNHRNLCHFTLDDDEAYEKTLEVLQKLVSNTGNTAVAVQPPFTPTDQEILDSLDMGDTLFASSSRAHQDTCDWIFDHQMFKSWLNEPSKFLWIRGRPGTGKTMLSRHLAKSFQHKFPQGPISQLQLLSFGFSMEDDRNLAVSFVKSVLHQLVTSVPGFLSREFLAECAAQKETLGSNWSRDAEFLKAGLLNFIQKFTAWGSSLLIVVDALDESKDPAEVLVLLERLKADGNSQATANTNGRLQGRVWIFVTSRFNPHLRSELEFQVSLSDNNLVDIQHFVSDSIVEAAARREEVQDTSSIQELTNIIVAKSAGTFLLATLLVKNILYRPDREHVQLPMLPVDLEGFYKMILAELKPQLHDQKLRQVPQKMLMLVLYAKRQLTALELWDALGLQVLWDALDLQVPDYRPVRRLQGTTQRYSGDENGKVFDTESRVTVDDIAHRIGLLSGGLLAVTTQITRPGKGKENYSVSTVGFIHQSVYDFLVQRTCLSVEKGTGEEDCNAEFEVARICLACIDETTPFPSKSACGSVVSHTNHFLQYAVLYVMSHLSSAGRQGLVPNASLVWKEDAFQYGFIDRWISLHKRFSGDYSLFKPRKTKAAHIMAYFGIAWFHSRIWGGVVQDLFSEDHRGRTPLVFAAALGHLDLCRILIDCGADVNHQDFVYGQTPLSYAAAHGHTETTKLLLDKLPPAGGKASQDALWLSIDNSHLRTAIVLLESRRGVGAFDPYTLQCVLNRACERGQTHIVSILLKQGARVEYYDGTGWTALHSCIKHGRKRTLQVLIDQIGPAEHRTLRESLVKSQSSWVSTIFRAIISDSQFRQCRSGEGERVGCGYEAVAPKTSRNDSKTSGQKRDRVNSETDSDDDECEEEEPKPSSKRLRSLDEKRLACPYRQAYPSKYSSRACTGAGFKDIHRVKSHVKKNHSLVGKLERCHACKQRYAPDKIVGHQPCELQNLADDYEEGFDAVQFEKLSGKDLKPSKSSGENCWRRIFKVLFPNWVRDLPSPYHTALVMTESRDITSVRDIMLSGHTINSIVRAGSDPDRIREYLERLLCNPSEREQLPQRVQDEPVPMLELSETRSSQSRPAPATAISRHSTQASPASSAMGLQHPQSANTVPDSYMRNSPGAQLYLPVGGSLLPHSYAHSYDGSMGPPSSGSGLDSGFSYMYPPQPYSNLDGFSHNTEFSSYPSSFPSICENCGNAAGSGSHNSSLSQGVNSGYHTPAGTRTSNTMNTTGGGFGFQDGNGIQQARRFRSHNMLSRPQPHRQQQQRTILPAAQINGQQQDPTELAEGSSDRQISSSWENVEGMQPDNNAGGSMFEWWP